MADDNLLRRTAMRCLRCKFLTSLLLGSLALALAGKAIAAPTVVLVKKGAAALPLLLSPVTAGGKGLPVASTKRGHNAGDEPEGQRAVHQLQKYVKQMS